jgi:UDP-glucose 4-epimerase
MSGARSIALVTGGAGFIGSALVRALVARGERVVVVDNLANGRRDNLVGLPGHSVRLIVADVRAPEDFTSELQAAHTVYHLACLGVRHSLHAPRENHAVNADGTRVLLEAARAAGVPRVVHVSSSEVYGSSAISIDECHPTRPTTAYGASKLAGERHARAFHAGDLAVAVVRPFNAYGVRCHHEGDAGEVIPKFVLRALAGQPLIVFGDGSQTRDFTYVNDTADGIARIGSCATAFGQIVNLGSGRAVTIRQLAAMVAAAVGRAVSIRHDAPRPGDLASQCADVRRARALVGFTPAVQFSDGLDRLVDWYRELGASPATLLAAERVRNWEVEARHVG